MPYFTSVLDDRNQPLPLSSNPTHWFTAAADGTVTGTNGPDAIYATSGHATLIGNGGDDTFYVNSHDTVAGGAGVDTVVTYWGGFALPEDVENLVVTGDGAVARGNHLDNLIAGGAGRQTFFGGGGHDVFEGGADSDIFVASRADHGNVVVNDFQSGVDRIRLDGTAFTGFASVQNSMTQAGGDVVVNLGDGQTLTLRGHQTTDFSAADFWTAIDLSHFQLAFADEFNSFDWSPDGSHGWRTTLDWEARTLPANHEAQYYSDSSVGVNPFHLHDGVLDIAATAGSNPLGLPYNSGVITTQGSFSQLYGYFEMRAELPAGAGLWPTFWLLPANHSWPPELDVFEVLGSDPTTAVVTVHSASTGAHTSVASAVATADLSEGFHTFGVNWKPDIIQWYIDGVEVAEAPTPADMHQPMYLLANLAVGGAGSWPGVADPSAFPATMTIDYIHVYRYSTKTPNDFNANGISDFLWQGADGTPAVWLMDGTTTVTVGAVGSNPGPSWGVKGSGDFNGDGKDDILWQGSDGTPAIWLMNGTDAVTVGAVGSNPGPSGEVKGSGDFNGDGKDDILWQGSDGTPAIWLMNGTDAVTVGAVGSNPGPSWEVKGSGDFNGDGRADILWQGSDGTPAIWLMNGTHVLSASAAGSSNPGPSWEVKDSGDFNGDGKSDILWQGSDGTAAIWLMDGTTTVTVGAVGSNPGPSWEVKGSGDFNGDGKSDIVWQSSDGTPAIWLMDGTNVLSTSAAGSFNPGSDWDLIV